MGIDLTDLANSINPARRDSRSVDELIAAALGLVAEDDAYWEAVAALQSRATREVFDRAVLLGRSDCPHERRTAAAILSQNLVSHCRDRDDCLTTLLVMLVGESDPEVLYAILVALGHIKHPDGIGPALPFVDHPDPDVRYGVIHALIGQDDDRAVANLIRLSRDPVVENRDWATFALGSMTERDAPELRAALADRLDDDDLTTAGEALVGLARRRDPRALPVLRDLLAAHDAGPLEFEAAELLADPDLLPLLLALDLDQGDGSSSLRAAIAACTPSPPG